MPNKTIYVKDADLKLWEQAQTELGESVSALFADCLRERLERRAVVAGKMGKITLEIGDPKIRKSFTGRWLIGTDTNGIQAEPDDSGVSWGHSSYYSVAQTAKGALVVYEYNDNKEEGEMVVYDNLEEMREDTLGSTDYPRWPENLIAATAEALGETLEIELDI